MFTGPVAVPGGAISFSSARSGSSLDYRGGIAEGHSDNRKPGVEENSGTHQIWADFMEPDRELNSEKYFIVIINQIGERRISSS